MVFTELPAPPGRSRSASLRALPLLLTALIPATASCTGAAIAAGGLLGYHPLWHHDNLTLSEAAILQDVGTLVWLIERGADPNRPSRVRWSILDSPEAMLTPIEAAVRASRIDIVDVLLRHGAMIHDDDRRFLVCLARRMGAADLEAYLTQPASSRSPAGLEPCS